MSGFHGYSERAAYTGPDGDGDLLRPHEKPHGFAGRVRCTSCGAPRGGLLHRQFEQGDTAPVHASTTSGGIAGKSVVVAKGDGAQDSPADVGVDEQSETDYVADAEARDAQDSGVNTLKPPKRSKKLRNADARLAGVPGQVTADLAKCPCEDHNMTTTGPAQKRSPRKGRRAQDRLRNPIMNDVRQDPAIHHTPAQDGADPYRRSEPVPYKQHYQERMRSSGRSTSARNSKSAPGRVGGFANGDGAVSLPELIQLEQRAFPMQPPQRITGAERASLGKSWDPVLSSDPAGFPRAGRGDSLLPPYRGLGHPNGSTPLIRGPRDDLATRRPLTDGSPTEPHMSPGDSQPHHPFRRLHPRENWRESDQSFTAADNRECAYPPPGHGIQDRVIKVTHYDLQSSNQPELFGQTAGVAGDFRHGQLAGSIRDHGTVNLLDGNSPSDFTCGAGQGTMSQMRG